MEEWLTENIKKSNGVYHLVNDGILSQKDCAILFQTNDDSAFILPPEVTCNLNVYSDTILNPGFLKSLNKNNITLNIFDKFSNAYIGCFVPANCENSNAITEKQIQIYCNEKKRLYYAAEIEKAAAFNIRSNLRYYNKNANLSSLQSSIEQITELMEKLSHQSDIPELMIVEAQIRNRYYMCFDTILKDTNFRFENRSKHPPGNEINAMISFGNALLYRRIATEIRKSRLDIRLGFIHSPNHRTETMHLDISEIFKPLIVDRIVFSLVNKKIVDKSAHFQPVENGVYLSKEGKKLFIHAFEEKMQTCLISDGIRTTYEGLIKQDLKKLLHSIEYDTPFKPYKYY